MGCIVVYFWGEFESLSWLAIVTGHSFMYGFELTIRMDLN